MAKSVGQVIALGTAQVLNYMRRVFCANTSLELEVTGWQLSYPPTAIHQLTTGLTELHLGYTQLWINL